MPFAMSRSGLRGLRDDPERLRHEHVAVLIRDDDKHLREGSADDQPGIGTGSIRALGAFDQLQFLQLVNEGFGLG